MLGPPASGTSRLVTTAVACFQLLHGGFIIFFIKYHDYLIPKLTGLSASNDVSMIFQRYIEE